MSEVRCLERSRLLYVTVDSSRLTDEDVRTCEFEGGRLVGEDGKVSLFSGRPRGLWDERLPALGEQRVDAAEARAVVTDLVKAWGGRARLQYMTRRAVRLVTGKGSSPRPCTSAVWALLGNVVTRSGHVVPAGWSGRGSGLPSLRDEAMKESFARMLDAVDRAEALPSGPSPAVLAPPAAAVVIHEAVGHFAEAAPAGRVDLRHRLGVRIAGEQLHLDDHPLVDGGAAHYTVDDDGTVVAPGAIAIVREGCLVAMLHSAASAAATGTSPTPNGRAASIWDPPIPRMSNLLCAPGEVGEEELVDNLGEGIYVHSLAYGYSFGFRLEAQIRLAEQVEGGRRTGRFYAGGMVTEDRSVLTRAVELGKDSVFYRNAMCGKEGQMLYDVGTQAPAIRLTELRLSA